MRGLIAALIVFGGIAFIVWAARARRGGGSQIYRRCRGCGASANMLSNLTNMYALGYGHDPEKFDKEVGTMCANHAGELTEKLLREGKVTVEQFAQANTRAMRFMMSGLEE